MLCRYASQAIDEFRSFLLLRQKAFPNKVKAPTELYHRNFLFFTRRHETTNFGNEKHKRTAETALFSYYQLFIKFLPLYSYTITKTTYTITETLILSRELTGSFHVRIRVLPDSIDFCVIVQPFPCEYLSFRDNNRVLPTSINYPVNSL